MPWFGQLVAGLSARTVYVRPVMYEAPKGPVSLPAVRFSPVHIIPPTLHTHLHIHVALTRTNGRSLVTFQKQCSLESRGTFDIKELSLPALPSPQGLPAGRTSTHYRKGGAHQLSGYQEQFDTTHNCIS